jgi:hypothetical protein
MKAWLDKTFGSVVGAVVGAVVTSLLFGPMVRHSDAAYIPVPSGTIAYFNSTSCPTGWAEFTNARGAYIVGRVASGTLNTLVGTALTDQENRATGVHNHTGSITINPHNHTMSGGKTFASWVTGAQIGASNGTGTQNTLDTQGLSVDNATATGSVTINNSSGTAGTNAPYIQLLVCKRN